MQQLPADFVASMSRQLPETELAAFFHAYEEPYVRGLRSNALKPADLGAIQADLGDSVPWEPTARYLSLASTAGAMPLHEAGAYYIQEPSAMLPAAVLDAQPGETILDLCAAPGGKTTQIAAAMQGRGLLVTNEPVPKRAQILSRNVERMGITNAVVVSAYPEQLAARWPEGFDAVMVDAPCSGEGMFRKQPETREEWSLRNREGCAERQASILDEAAKLVRPGGRLVYSTCTLNREENENNAIAFCARHPEFVPEAFTLPGIDAPDGMYTMYPHKHQGEGQFAARFRKAGDGEAQLPLHRFAKTDKLQLQALASFCKSAPVPSGLFGDCLVSMPGCPDLTGIKALRVGLHLGTMKGKVFTPDHAWAVAADRPDFPAVALSEAQAASYLHGEAIPCDDALRGYVLPTIGGLVLGWGKASDGMIKNHYPKGLRR